MAWCSLLCMACVTCIAICKGLISAEVDFLQGRLCLFQEDNAKLCSAPVITAVKTSRYWIATLQCRTDNNYNTKKFPFQSYNTGLLSNGHWIQYKSFAFYCIVLIDALRGVNTVSQKLSHASILRFPLALHYAQNIFMWKPFFFVASCLSSEMRWAFKHVS